MEFQVIDYVKEKLPLFLFLYHFDPTDLRCQRAWIREAPVLYQTGFSISGGLPDTDSYRRSLRGGAVSCQGFPYPLCHLVSLILSLLFFSSLFVSICGLCHCSGRENDASAVTFQQRGLKKLLKFHRIHLSYWNY